MREELKWWTVSETLAACLRKLMQIPELTEFRLVGGTSLSLQLGHRMSDDVVMFTDTEYGSVDFREIEIALKVHFNYVNDEHLKDFSFGIMRFVGLSSSDFVKLDLFHTEPFLRGAKDKDGIRMASIEDIITMKLETIATGGRKRDFWDIHEFLEAYSLDRMMELFRAWNPWREIIEVLRGLTKFDRAELEDDPVCFKGKFWELIKLDIEEAVEEYREKEPNRDL